MKHIKLVVVAAARPNFMKIAPLIRAISERSGVDYVLVHTGQHYDHAMSEVYFEELGIPSPHYNLGVGSGSHSEQTGRTMLAFEPGCIQEKPDAVVVVGDVNATLACALVARKLNIPVAHVEAGLRSGDMTMPEEVNRIVTDAISDWLFVTEESALANLKFEGRFEKAHLVGHTMIDNLLHEVALLDSQKKDGMMSEAIIRRLKNYAVVTLHRPSNVDDAVQLEKLTDVLREVAGILPVVFVAHPRTAKNLASFKIEIPPGVEMTPPLPYGEFLNLWRSARVVLTDSGGLQEETTALGIPCLTMRDSTERPITVDEGTNVVVGQDANRIVEEVRRILAGDGKSGKRPAIWDGQASRRIVDLLCNHLVARNATT